jgi:hypothetical protein
MGGRTQNVSSPRAFLSLSRAQAPHVHQRTCMSVLIQVAACVLRSMQYCIDAEPSLICFGYVCTTFGYVCTASLGAIVPAFCAAAGGVRAVCACHAGQGSDKDLTDECTSLMPFLHIFFLLTAILSTVALWCLVTCLHLPAAGAIELDVSLFGKSERCGSRA